jgi:hypothetical protein
VLHYRCDPYLFFFLGCRSDQNRVHPSVRHLNWKTVPFRLNTTCVRNSITGSVCGFLPLSLSSLSVGKEREGGSPFFSSFVVFQRTAGLLVVKRERLSLRDGIYETEGKRFCYMEKSRFLFPFFCVCVLSSLLLFSLKFQS